MNSLAGAGPASTIWAAYSQELTNGGLQSIVWQRSTDGGESFAPPLTISDGREHNSRGKSLFTFSCVHLFPAHAIKTGLFQAFHKAVS